MPLPHESFDSIWESLVYGEPIAEKILRTLTRAIHEKKDRASSWPISWQKTILLYGPPGSGKTTFAQALAQRLSIRLPNTLISTKFIQVNAHALFSRYFGETAEQIGQIFKTILSMAADESQLPVVMADEVEFVASSRKLASPSGRADTIRVSVVAVCYVTLYSLS
jgi:ATP-dependent 26S proteasome regulatory subunit